MKNKVKENKLTFQYCAHCGFSTLWVNKRCAHCGALNKTKEKTDEKK